MGWLLLLAGLGLAAWAVRAAAEARLERPGGLVRRGPYTRSPGSVRRYL